MSERNVSIFRERFLLLLLAVTLLAGSCALADAPAVRVNDRTFSVETVQKYVNESAANMPLTMGQTAQDVFGDAKEEFLNAAAEHFVTVAIVEDRLKARGLDRISDEEVENLQDYARQAYEQIWQSMSEQMKEEFPDMDGSDRIVTETIENAGYSMDGIYEKAVQSLLMGRFTAEFCPDLTVTDEEARSFFETSYVGPDRELYENDLGLFEQRVLLQGESSTYIPEGYYYVKYIALKPSDERAAAIAEAERTLAEAQAAAAAAQEELARAAMDENGLTGAREAYRIASEEAEKAAAAMAEQQALAEKDYGPMAELIRNALAEGETFESLIGKHSVQQIYTGRDEPGYPFHPESPNWEDGVRERIAALTGKGDCTDPIWTNGTVCVYCRMDDMTCGAYEPDEETWDMLKQSLLEAKQSDAVNEKVAEWRDEYEIGIDLTGLVFPE